jgi:hypothetical protein
MFKQQKNSPRLAGAVLAALLAIGPAASGDTPSDTAGYIQEISAGSDQQLSITNGKAGRPEVAELGRSVRSGDEISVPAGASIRLSLIDGGKPPVFKGPGTFVVPQVLAPRLLSRLFARLQRTLTTSLPGSDDAMGHKRGNCDELSVPILRPGAQLLAGSRKLDLLWTSGCAPYEVTVFRGDTVLVRRSDLSQPQIELALDLTPGIYRVTIRRVDGLPKAFPLTVQPKLPPIPAELTGSSDVATLARALWLAEKDGGVWRLDSLEMLRPLRRRNDPLALALGNQLLTREAPLSTEE